MQKTNDTVLLNLKRKTWLAAPAAFTMNSAVYAAETSPTHGNQHSENLFSTLTNMVSSVPLNAVAWLSLSAIMAILFFSKQPAAKQPSAPGVGKVD